MSWEEINKEPEVSTEELENQKKFDELVYQVFELSPSGKDLYKMLDIHYNTPVCPPDKDSKWGFFREGQNSIIRQFRQAIQRHDLLTRETQNA